MNIKNLWSKFSSLQWCMMVHMRFLSLYLLKHAGIPHLNSVPGPIWEWLFYKSESCRRDGGRQTLRHLSSSSEVATTRETTEFYMNCLPHTSVWLQSRGSKPCASAHVTSFSQLMVRHLKIIDFLTQVPQ